MSVNHRLTRTYNRTPCISIPGFTPIVIFSDCHRGCGNNSDNFMQNKSIYMAALRYYFERNYIYIELGDGDELWENRRMSDIIAANEEVFGLLSCFYQKDRMLMLYGNHDMVKRKRNFIEESYEGYYDKCRSQHIELFPGIEVHEALRIKYCNTGTEYFLVHGNQGELINDRFWKLGRFLVRYFWRPLELFGVKDPLSTSANCNRYSKRTGQYISWAERNNVKLIAGHTHQPAAERFNSGAYFNSGSCVKSGSITALELYGDRVFLIKWQVKTDLDNRMYVGREVVVQIPF